VAQTPTTCKSLPRHPHRHNTTGTLWNSKVSRPVITTPAFDTDGQPESFNELEQLTIVAIWRAVAEDYAPFDIDVSF
jgi:hypothetical protein